MSKKRVDAIVAIMDEDGGLCSCQSYRGESHDQMPPCDRVRLARKISKELATEGNRYKAVRADGGWDVLDTETGKRYEVITYTTATGRASGLNSGEIDPMDLNWTGGWS